MANYALVTPTPFKVENLRLDRYYAHSFSDIEMYHKCRMIAAKRCLGFWRIHRSDMTSYQHAAATQSYWECDDAYAKWWDEMLSQQAPESEFVKEFLELNQLFKQKEGIL